MQDLYVIVDGLRMKLADALELDTDVKSISAQWLEEEIGEMRGWKYSKISPNSLIISLLNSPQIQKTANLYNYQPQKIWWL